MSGRSEFFGAAAGELEAAGSALVKEGPGAALEHVREAIAPGLFGSPSAMAETSAPAAPSIVNSDRIGTILTRPHVEHLSEALWSSAQTWPSVTPELKAINEATQKLGNLAEDVQENLYWHGIRINISRPHDHEEVRERLKDLPDLLREYNGLDESLGMFRWIHGSLEQKVDQRFSIYSSTSKSIARDIGLPQSEYKIFSDPFAHAQSGWEPKNAIVLQGSYADGLTKFRDDLFKEPAMGEQLISVGPHEMTHLEQHYLMTCLLADKAGIREKATPDQVAALLRQFHDNGIPTSQSTLESFLAQRGGRHLDDRTEERAKDVYDSFAEFHATVPEYPFDSNNRMLLLSGFDQIKDQPGFADAMAAALRTEKESHALAYTLYGRNGATAGHAELQRKYGDIVRSHEPTDEMPGEHSDIIRSGIVEKIAEATAQIKDNMGVFDRVYAKALHEHEAADNGSIAVTKIVSHAHKERTDLLKYL